MVSRGVGAGDDGSVIVGKILEKDQYSFGYDARSGEYVNMMSKGIIDPTKVVRAALQNAASVAGLLITTEAMVAELPTKQTPPIVQLHLMAAPRAATRSMPPY
jgi:chaperonin GroEL